MHFKKVLFLILSVFALSSFDLNAQETLEMSVPQEEAQQNHFQPPKISELKASLFEVLHDEFLGIYDYFKSGLVSLGDFLETAEWIIGNLKSPKA